MAEDKKYELLSQDLNQVVREFPDLEIVKRNGTHIKLQGPLKIFDRDDYKREVFETKITIPYSKYPYAFPSLKEISNKIPKTPERHINGDGTCCVAVSQEERIRSQKGIKIFDFIKEYAIPFLANQIYFEETGEWYNGEYPHGKEGELYYYKKEFKTHSLAVILKGLEIVINEKKIKRNNYCFCGSYKKFKNCHRFPLEEIKKLPNDKLIEDKNMIENFYYDKTS
jgi:hypothetical protein